MGLVLNKMTAVDDRSSGKILIIIIIFIIIFIIIIIIIIIINANRFLASQEITRILWNPKVHYHIHKCPQPVPILSQLDPGHASHPTLRRPVLILFSHLQLVLPSGLFPSDFPTKTLYTLFSIRATCLAHFILLDLIT